MRLRGNICETFPVPVLIACIDTRKFATSFGFGLSANTGGGRRIIAGLIAGQKRAQRSKLYQYGRKYY